MTGWGWEKLNETVFLMTERKSDGHKRFYVGGCRVTKAMFETVGDGRRYSLRVVETKNHWRHYHCRRL